jgi:hypothetical protein
MLTAHPPPRFLLEKRKLGKENQYLCKPPRAPHGTLRRKIHLSQNNKKADLKKPVVTQAAVPVLNTMRRATTTPRKPPYFLLEKRK